MASPEITKGDRVRLTAEALSKLTWAMELRGVHGTAQEARTYGKAVIVPVAWPCWEEAMHLNAKFLEVVKEPSPDDPLPPEIARRFAHVEITE